MDSMLALAMGRANFGKESMVFDWEKAARIIKERAPEVAEAGLRDDWEWTGGIIWKDGKPITDDYTYLSSTWAVPELIIDDEIIECYVMQSQTEWNEKTKWPQKALDIVLGHED